MGGFCPRLREDAPARVGPCRRSGEARRPSPGIPAGAGASRAGNFRYSVGKLSAHSSSSQTGPLPMLYAILCYHDEDVTTSWTEEHEAGVMQKLAVVQDKLAKQ